MPGSADRLVRKDSIPNADDLAAGAGSGGWKTARGYAIRLLAMATDLANPISKVPTSKGDLTAAGYMLVTTVSFSLIPLIVSLAGGSQAPFLFNAWLRVGTSIGCLLFLLTFCHSTLFNGSAVALVGERIFRWPPNKFLILATIGTFDYGLFAWSTQYLDIAVAALLFETQPVFLIFLTAWLFKEEDRYQKVTLTNWLMILLGLGGFIFAISSQSAGFDGYDNIIIALWNLVISSGTAPIRRNFGGYGDYRSIFRCLRLEMGCGFK